MERENLIIRIIPTILRNTDESQKNGNSEFDTKDLIYIESSYDKKSSKYYKNISFTDYARISGANTIRIKNSFMEEPLKIFLRSAFNRYRVQYAYQNNKISHENTDNQEIGLAPSLHFSLPQDNSEKVTVKEVRDKNGEILYHVLLIGEYLKNDVGDDFNDVLEAFYNNGKICKGLNCTGRWYSSNGQKGSSNGYAGKHSPEFEYRGNRYARVVLTENNSCKIKWIKVEPMAFIIKNWEEMPKNINPNGNGTAEYFDLTSEEAIISNIPFYPNKNDENISIWQNSTIRGFLNGIDVRNITENGNIQYTAPNGGDFTGECNFLNEAFNLAREPMLEYEIPESETNIPDDAFNGCVSLKKIIIHPGIQNVGKRAFDGLDFKYAYRTEKGDLIFSQEIPENEKSINIEEISKSLIGFDYTVVFQNQNMDDIIKLSKILNKKNMRIPYIYGLQLIKFGQAESFRENSDFRFFKNEIPNINELLANYPEEERLDFYKFANAIGCFSTEKILDKNGQKTQTFIAQKASSLLAALLKTEGMKLRELPWVISFIVNA